MIERIDDMPDGTIGFRARGEIEAEDYKEVPGEAAVFPLAELAQAKVWVAGG